MQVRRGGVAGLYHGFRANLAFRSWFFAMFGSYNVLITQINGFAQRNPTSHFALSPSAANFLAGGLASEVFWLGSFPFDAVKKCALSPTCDEELTILGRSRMMSDSISDPRYPTWTSAFQSIWREGGPRVRRPLIRITPS